MVSRVHNEEAAQSLTTAEFRRLSEFIHVQCGIKMPPAKKIMLEARLQKRLKTLGITRLRDYCDYVLDTPEGRTEIVHMIDAATTNKTDFFRESSHFRFLVDTAVPSLLNGNYVRSINIWSAGCSSGEEPYTLAMILSEYTHQQPGFRFAIIATDISTKILEQARSGIYDEDRVVDVPSALKQKYLLRSKDRKKKLVRIVPELRSVVQFQHLNLMNEHYVFSVPMDIIFCRNVIIYFDRETQYKLLVRLCRYLRPDGFLFLGHSESIHGFDLPLVRMAATIFRKTV